MVGRKRARTKLEIMILLSPLGAAAAAGPAALGCLFCLVDFLTPPTGAAVAAGRPPASERRPPRPLRVDCLRELMMDSRDWSRRDSDMVAEIVVK
jgi:hypothetical protein